MELENFIVLGAICVLAIYVRCILDQYEISLQQPDTQKLTYYKLSDELAETLNSFFTRLPNLPLRKRMRQCEEIMELIDERIQDVQKMYLQNAKQLSTGDFVSHMKEEQAMLCLLEEVFELLSGANLVDAYDLNPYIREINDLIHIFLPSISVETLQFKKT